MSLACAQVRNGQREAPPAQGEASSACGPHRGDGLGWGSSRQPRLQHLAHQLGDGDGSDDATRRSRFAELGRQPQVPERITDLVARAVWPDRRSCPLNPFYPLQLRNDERPHSPQTARASLLLYLGTGWKRVRGAIEYEESGPARAHPLVTRPPIAHLPLGRSPMRSPQFAAWLGVGTVGPVEVLGIRLPCGEGLLLLAVDLFVLPPGALVVQLADDRDLAGALDRHAGAALGGLTHHRPLLDPHHAAVLEAVRGT